MTTGTVCCTQRGHSHTDGAAQDHGLLAHHRLWLIPHAWLSLRRVLWWIVQKALTGAALAACRFCPQLLQKALLAGTSAWQAGQWRVKGCAGVAETATVCSAEPQ